MEDRIGSVHLEKFRTWKNALDVVLEWLPAATGQPSPAWHLEVVDDEKAAFLQPVAKPRRFPLGHRPPADFDDVRDRIVEQLGIIERDDVHLFEVSIQNRHLL